MKEKKYVVGIIKDNNVSVGVALYCLNSKQIEIKSMNSAINELHTQGNIIGLKSREQTVYLRGKDTYEVRNYTGLLKTYYDTRKLPIIDCEGNVLKEGCDVCVGTVGIGDTKKYIIVNSKGKMKLLTKEEVKEIKIVGIIQCDDRINVIRDCKNVYMTMSELEEA